MNAHPAGPRHAEEFHHGGVPPRPESAAELLQLAPNVWPRNTVRGDFGVEPPVALLLQGASLTALTIDLIRQLGLETDDKADSGGGG